MKTILYIVGGFLLSFVVSFALLGAIDLEIARRDYVEIVKGNKEDAQVSGCIFAYSCNKYNDLLIAHFHW